MRRPLLIWKDAFMSGSARHRQYGSQSGVNSPGQDLLFTVDHALPSNSRPWSIYEVLVSCEKGRWRYSALFEVDAHEDVQVVFGLLGIYS